MAFVSGHCFGPVIFFLCSYFYMHTLFKVLEQMVQVSCHSLRGVSLTIW